MNNREHERFGGDLVVDGIPSLIAAAHELKAPLALVRQLSLMLETGDVSSN